MTNLNFDESMGPVMVNNPYTGKPTDMDGFFLMIKQVCDNDFRTALLYLQDIARAIGMYTDLNVTPEADLRNALYYIYSFMDALNSIKELK